MKPAPCDKQEKHPLPFQGEGWGEVIPRLLTTKD
jgi:hypothetical protein